ncbi:MAG TPA: hypothetical protein VM689_08390 [Aliidongia sp.]|nr:hypothetical protein [Aliidongia sp.]
MKVTDKLRQSMRNLLQEARDEVGLVMRFDEDDTTIQTIWSEGYVDVPGVDQSSLKRIEAERIDLKKSGFQTSDSQPELGGHAEEIMIRRWAFYEKEYGRQPKLVDIVLTHSPCWDVSGILKIDNSQWPAGCGPKLYRLVTERNYVSKWQIAYFKYYGTAKSADAAKQSIQKLEGHPRVATYFFHTIP